MKIHSGREGGRGGERGVSAAWRAAWVVALLIGVGGGGWQQVAAQQPKGAGAEVGVWGVTLHSQERGGCSRGFYNDSVETAVRLDLSAPLAPTLVLDVRRLHTSGSFAEGKRVSPPPQWEREVRRFEGALLEARSAGETQWGFWLVSEQTWRFTGYPSEEQKDGSPHMQSEAQNAAPDLQLTCKHDWLVLESGDKVVAMACLVEVVEVGDVMRPALRWAAEGERGEQLIYVTQGEGQVEGELESIYGGGAVTWRRRAAP